MLISYKQMKKVKVETQSGIFLGYLSDFELETDTGIIEKYYVQSKNLISGLLAGKLLISKNQIISFDEEKMVVEDNLVKEKAGQKKLENVEKIEGVEPVITSKLG